MKQKQVFVRGLNKRICSKLRNRYRIRPAQEEGQRVKGRNIVNSESTRAKKTDQVNLRRRRGKLRSKPKNELSLLIWC